MLTFTDHDKRVALGCGLIECDTALQTTEKEKLSLNFLISSTPAHMSVAAERSKGKERGERGIWARISLTNIMFKSVKMTLMLRQC